ncbi:MAG: outer membrane protein assembly factor BamD [Rikenellaceae bacterium]
MKKRNITKYTVGAIVLFVCATLFAGCSTTYKVIQRGDADEIYNLALEKYEAEEWNKAAKLFTYVSSYYEGTNRDDSIKFFNARSLFKSSSYEIAAESLDEFRRQYGRSIFLEDAEGMFTLCYYYMAPGPTRDSAMITNAIMVINEFLSRYPNSAQAGVFTELREELIARLHEKSFANAYTYYKTEYYKSAIIAFKNALREYPDSKYREQISYYTVASAYELATKSVMSKKEDRFLDMIDSYYTFIAAYPESEYRDEVDRMLKKANNYIDSKAKGEEIETDSKAREKREPKREKQEKNL